MNIAKKPVLLAVVVASLALLLLAGCNRSSGHVQAARTDARAAASAPAVQHDEALAKTRVIDPCLQTTRGLVALVHCTEAKLGITGHSAQAKARRKALGDCLYAAARADKAYVKGNTAGRQQFYDAGAPQCVGAQLGSTA